MFETERFYNQLQDAIATEIKDRGGSIEAGEAAAFLRGLAIANEAHLMEIERKERPSTPRGSAEALVSARVIAREAFRIASLAQRSRVTLSDFTAAHKAKFCQIWPFCK